MNPFLPAVPRHLKQPVNVAKATAGVATGGRNALSLAAVAFQSRMRGWIAPVINYWDTAKALERLRRLSADGVGEAAIV